MGRKRALIAATLAVVYPGLGHVYLRTWFRAVTWFGLAMLTAAVVLPNSVVTAYESGGFGGVLEASQSIPMRAFLAITAVRVLNAIDAAWIGLRSRSGTPSDAGAPTCPNCGRELDDDLDFCHWCTKSVEGATEESKVGGGLL